MTYTEAIRVRISNRSYLDQPLTAGEISQLEKMIDSGNRAGGLRMQLLLEQPEAFASLRRSYGIITGVRNMVALVGPADLPHLREKLGYYGEQIVLGATAMGLGTCWVCGTYDKDKVPCRLASGEVLCGVIAVGHTAVRPGLKEKMIRGVLLRRSKSSEELSQGADQAPEWFAGGIKAVMRAPSAVNTQGFRFSWTENGVIGEKTSDHSCADMDLGIAKLHFELGAHGGAWTWGDKGVFTKAAEEKSCGAVIWRKTENGHQYLLAQHGAKHWSFPKGHVENNETEEETAKREIWEETGLTAEIDTRFRQVVTYYPKPNVVKDVVFFVAQPTGGTEHAQEEEIRQLGWFSFEESKALVTFATDIEVLKAAEAYINQ